MSEIKFLLKTGKLDEAYFYSGVLTMALPQVAYERAK